MRKRAAVLLLTLVMTAAFCAPAGATGFLEPYKDLFRQYNQLHVLLAKDSIWDFETDELMSIVDYTLIELDETSAGTHPELSTALEKINRQRIEDAEALSAEMGALAREASADMPFSAAFDYYVQRADQKVLSFRSDSELYWGGAHADYGTAGVNLNTDTGEEIALSDVVSDIPVLISRLACRLVEKYPDETFDDPETLLLSFAEEELQWTLGYEGITFYFNPYTILNYPSGRISATIRYDEAEELFNQKYLPAKQEAYAVQIPAFERVDLGITGADGKVETVQVNAWMDDYDAYDVFEIECGDGYLDQALYAYSFDISLVSTGRGEAQRVYLYLEAVQESDYTTLYVFDLNGKQPAYVGELSGSGYEGSSYTGKAVLNDPSDFKLDTRLDIIGTRFGTRSYSVHGETGMPVPKQDYFEISGFGYPMTSLIPLKVQMLDTNEEATVPAGTAFYEIRTDGETYMDFRLDDGTECRIEIDTSGYPDRINGIPEDECFEGIIYAG